MPYVEATLISWVDYDPAEKSLSVRFRAAPVLYTYPDVPARVYDAFLAAPSKNRFFKQEIAPTYRQVTPPLSQAGEGPVGDAQGLAAEI